MRKSRYTDSGLLSRFTQQSFEACCPPWPAAKRCPMKNGTKTASKRKRVQKQSRTDSHADSQLSRSDAPGEQPVARRIQIELRSPLWTIPARSKAESAFRFSSHASDELASLHELFREHRLSHAHPSFRKSQPRQKRKLSQTDKDNFSRFVDLHFPSDADFGAIVRALRSHADVAQAMEVLRYRPAAMPTDPLIGNAGNGALLGQAGQDPTGLNLQWYLFRCKVDQAWQRATGNGVVIADVDAGFYLQHQDLVANVEPEHSYNAVDGSTDVSSQGETSHGTGVLGLAGAASNGIGMAGVAYDARLWALQTDAGNGQQLLGDPVANAIAWIGAHDPRNRRVVVLIEQQTASEGNIEQSPAVQAAIVKAINDGYVVCVAAGNGDKDAAIADDGTPIPDTGSILVGATEYAGADNPRAVWGNEASNWGNRITVSAPGDPMNDVTCRDQAVDDYAPGFGGTSGAAAKVAGTIALMLEANPNLTHAQVKQILAATGTALTNDKPMGVFLNAASAVQRAAQLYPNHP